MKLLRQHTKCKPVCVVPPPSEIPRSRLTKFLCLGCFFTLTFPNRKKRESAKNNFYARKCPLDSWSAFIKIMAGFFSFSLSI